MCNVEPRFPWWIRKKKKKKKKTIEHAKNNSQKLRTKAEKNRKHEPLGSSRTNEKMSEEE